LILVVSRVRGIQTVGFMPIATPPPTALSLLGRGPPGVSISNRGPNGSEGVPRGAVGDGTERGGTGGNRLLYYRSYYPGILLVLPCQLTDPPYPTAPSL